MVHFRNGSPYDDGSTAFIDEVRESAYYAHPRQLFPTKCSCKQILLLAMENVGFLGKSGITPVNLLATDLIVGADGCSFCRNGVVK